MNIAIFEDFLNDKDVSWYLALLKVGIYDYQNMWDLFFYMMPEVMIITFIMLNEIKLKLLGLFDRIETDIESVHTGI